MNDINALDTLVKQSYFKLHKLIFDTSFKRATLLLKEQESESAYNPDDDVIIISIPEISEEDFLFTSMRIPVWFTELLHEMIHEYQFKVIKEETKEGIDLYTKLQYSEDKPKIWSDSKVSGFEGKGHNAVFYTALLEVAKKLEVDFEKLVESVLLTRKDIPTTILPDSSYNS